MKKFVKKGFIVLLILTFIGTMFYLYNKSKEKPITYKVETPSKNIVEDKIVASGKVEPRKQVEIKSKVTGSISKIFITAGEVVKQGTIIATMEIIPSITQIPQAEAEVKVTKINLENITRKYNRQKDLFDKKFISEQEFQDISTEYKNAIERNKAANENLEIVKKGFVINDKSGTNLNNIIATISGMVLDIPVKEGTFVTAVNNFNSGTTIAIMADMKDILFKGKIDEISVEKVKVGMPININVGAIDNVIFKAVLEYVAPKSVEENGVIQFEIWAKINVNDTSLIRAGLSASADIILKKTDSVMVIKEQQIIFSNDSTFVEIEKAPNVFDKKLIKIGVSDGINAEVLEGVKMTDKIKIQ